MADRILSLNVYTSCMVAMVYGCYGLRLLCCTVARVRLLCCAVAMLYGYHFVHLLQVKIY